MRQHGFHRQHNARNLPAGRHFRQGPNRFPRVGGDEKLAALYPAWAGFKPLPVAFDQPLWVNAPLELHVKLHICHAQFAQGAHDGFGQFARCFATPAREFFATGRKRLHGIVNFDLNLLQRGFEFVRQCQFLFRLLAIRYHPREIAAVLFLQRVQGFQPIRDFQ